MKELDLGLSKGLLDSVSGVLKDSSKAKAEVAKTANEQLSAQYTKMTARPLSTEEAKVNTYASKAPERRVNDAISAVYAKSVSEAAAQQKAEAEAIQRAYAARGAAKPISEEKTIKGAKTNVTTDPTDAEVLKSRKAKMQADVSDETILDGQSIDEKTHTVPKTDKEKKLAAIAEPKDKITHADVLTGRGVRKEGFAEMDAWLKKRKAEEGTGKFEKKKISTGTVYTKKPEKQQKVDEAMETKTPAKNTDVSDKSWLKTAGKKPGPLHNVAKGLKAFVQGKPEPMESVDVGNEAIHEKITLDKDGNKIGGGTVFDTLKDKTKFKPSFNKTNPFDHPAYTKKPQSTVPAGAVTKEEVEQVDEISIQTMKSAKEKLQDKAFDAHMDDNKSAARHYAGRAVSMTAKIKQKQRQMTAEELDLEEATHVFSGFTGFMKKHASKLRDAGLKVKKIIHDEDSGTTEYHVSGPRAAAKVAGKEYEKADKGQNYGGHITEDAEQIDELNAKTLASYINKAKHSVASQAYAFGANADTQDTANKFANRLVGINKATKGLVKKIKEETDTPGNSTHQCAIHVKHAKLGEGKTLFSQHAAPDAEGNIAWYDVMFAEGIEKKVPTTDLEILVSESHMNHKKKKAM
jgi:hypothetical protein